MLKIDLHTLPTDFSSLNEQLDVIAKRPEPDFATYEPDLQTLYALAGKYAGVGNFIVIGRGGSVNGFRALYSALAKYRTTKRVHILDTLDPEYVGYLRQKCRPEDTLVIVISKSGDTVEVLEDLLCFQEYRKVVVTENANGALHEVAKVRELELVKHPPISGRFSIGTESAMLPGALIYTDVRSMRGGMKAVFKQCHPNRPIAQNPALSIAAALLLADRAGKSEVYAPVYSKALAGSLELWTQLMHETVCKQGQGQTFLFQEAPECQHHTSQKFFDGPQRMLGLFVKIDKREPDLAIPEDPQLQGLHVGQLPLRSLMGTSMTRVLNTEYEGVRMAADEARIPNATITLDVLNPGTFGELSALMMYVAVYSAWLRGLEAFDQPGVEASKRNAIEARKALIRGHEAAQAAK